MEKTDLRHANNARANKDLHIELNLWIAYRNNGEKPILLGIAVAEPHKGYFGDTYKMFYSPVDYDKTRPFIVQSENGISDYSVRSESIRQAKYYLKRYNSTAKWQKVKTDA